MSECTKYRELIKSSINEPLKEADQKMIDHHAQSCAECQSLIKRVSSLKKSLNCSEVEVPENIKSSLHLRLVGESEKLKQKPQTLYEKLFGFQVNDSATLSISRAISYVTAFTAIIVFIGLFMLHRSEIGKKEMLISQSEVSQGAPVTISLEYVAKEDIPNASFTIELDSGLAFYTEHNAVKKLKTHTWQGGLKKGSNVIPFVVNVLEKGELTIMTRADFEGFSHSHKIVLESLEGKVTISYYKLPDEKIKI